MTIAADQQSTPRIRTVSIGPSHHCPSVQPIPEQGFTYDNRHFTAAQLAIVGAAIDAGVFYTDDLKAYCRDAWQALHPAVDVCLTASDAGNAKRLEGMDQAQRREASNALREAVAAAPRGTWGLLRLDWKTADWHSGVTYTMFISDGQGHAHPVHNRFNGRDPNYYDALASMVGYEIYVCDSAEKARREQDRSQAIIRSAGIAPGMKLRNVTIGSTTYSSATVEAVSDIGGVKLCLTKRGSRNRWHWTGLAQSIRADNLAPSAPAYGTLVVSEH